MENDSKNIIVTTTAQLIVLRVSAMAEINVTGCD
jgi:hypothetical protein